VGEDGNENDEQQRAAHIQLQHHVHKTDRKKKKAAPALNDDDDEMREEVEERETTAACCWCCRNVTTMRCTGFFFSFALFSQSLLYPSACVCLLFVYQLSSAAAAPGSRSSHSPACLMLLMAYPSLHDSPSSQRSVCMTGTGAYERQAHSFPLLTPPAAD
jgi:hypothetical protein